MRRFFFRTRTGGNANAPFWMPWGIWRWLGRLLLYLLFAGLFLFLISLIHRCDRPADDAESVIPEDWRPDPGTGPDHEGDIPIDTTTNYPIPDIDDPNLPAPDDNRIRPVDPDDIITDDDGARQIVSNRLNVILNSDANDETFKKWAAEFKALYPGDDYKILFYDNLTKLIQIQVPDDQRSNILRTLPSQITDISFKIFDEAIMDTYVRFDDPVFSDATLNWFYEPIQAYEAWDITQGDPNIIIAIVDSYFDLNHDELNSERIFAPYSVIKRTGNVAPDHGVDGGSLMHGTMVATLAAGNADNGKGFAGIAPKCRLMPISLGTTLTSMTMIQGTLYAIYQGANVVNISIGNVFPEAISSMSDAEQVELSKKIGLYAQDVWDYVFQLADERNVTIVWAAGNEDIYAALDDSKRNETTVRVSALGPDLKKASFSNYGNLERLGTHASNISAPGEDLVGAKPYNDYTVSSGTSFSAPIVTGAIALMKSLDATLTNRQIIEILESTGRPLPSSPTIGPLLQIRDALLKVKGGLVASGNIFENHNDFNGLWESVDLKRIYETTEDGKSTPTSDYCRLFLDIASPSSGKCIYYEETSSKKDYSSPVTMTWAKDRLTITMTSKATSPGMSDSYVKSTYVVTYEDGQVICQRTLPDPGNPFIIKKIPSRPKK